jgi:hypothetical protein
MARTPRPHAAKTAKVVDRAHAKIKAKAAKSFLKAAGTRGKPTGSRLGGP